VKTFLRVILGTLLATAMGACTSPQTEMIQPSPSVGDDNGIVVLGDHTAVLGPTDSSQSTHAVVEYHFATAQTEETLWAALFPVAILEQSTIERITVERSRTLGASAANIEVFLLPGAGPTGTSRGLFPVDLSSEEPTAPPLAVHRGETYRLIVRAQMPASEERAGLVAVVVHFSDSPAVRVPFPLSWCVRSIQQGEPCQLTDDETTGVLDEANNPRTQPEIMLEGGS